MNLFKITMATLTVAIFAFSCRDNVKSESPSHDSKTLEKTIFWVDSISELDDSQYPDNPDISIRSNLDGTFSHSKISFEKNNLGYDMVIYPKNKSLKSKKQL